VKKSCLTWVVVYVLLALGLWAWFSVSVRDPASDISPPPASMPSRAWLVIGGALDALGYGLGAAAWAALAAAWAFAFPIYGPSLG